MNSPIHWYAPHNNPFIITQQKDFAINIRKPDKKPFFGELSLSILMYPIPTALMLSHDIPSVKKMADDSATIGLILVSSGSA
ncbi:hypothetical protein [Thermoactinomyces mirandus]|uniref:hypothetical protein n=1 Tax=Thermoactinomyces mirandus TaxID=2756294 RepID=UPI001C692439|nr:hypothetical protein [Thermoactinomyces mirandus]